MTFSVRILLPDHDGLYDFGSSKSKVVVADSIDISDPRWLVVITEHEDGSITRTMYPMEIVIEVSETIAAKEVKKAKRFQKEHDRMLADLRGRRRLEDQNRGYR